ncbi:carbohydrate ABC transporter permease [Litorilinea aerophila]|uniref:Carbohydrate ABC transporter permease n=1 Tax=Litorilinea aerophila TaxID=1204385 RepID=A0A540VD35_9CHLR|nr:carbohydrate ABC transporter permease [Litorilinea aerophila]MCC9077538.1 carbohydrate ABC transporter permease [Litorilinea aerophila]GIV79377.1 MAG: sugar ABC transporter permease [Litorilinea sp.]
MAKIIQPLETSAPRPMAAAPRKASTVQTTPIRAVMYLILLLGMAVAMLPFFWMISASLMTYGETATRRWWPEVPQFVNYVEAWNEAKFYKYFTNSVVITATTLAGQLTTSILAAYAFARIKFWGRDFLFGVLLSTMMIPSMVTMIPNFLIIRGGLVPLPTLDGSGSWLNTLQGITVPYMASVFSIFLLRQFFAQIPWELWDAARMDGASHLRFLVQIVLPISKAPIFTVTIFGFIGAWNDFLWPLLVTTRDTWRPLMVGLWTLQSEAGPETQLIMAASVITILPILLLYFLTQRQFTEGIATSGLKG